MALGTPVDGGAAYSASGGTSVAPTYPAGIAAGDALVLIVGQKPSTANGGTVTTPSGWTLREELTAAGGYGTTLGADTGNTNLRFYTKDTVTGAETGTQSVTLGTNNVSWGLIVRVPAAGGTLSYGSATGSRTTAPTLNVAFNVAMTDDVATPTAFETGDVALWAMCIPTDVTTPSQFSGHDFAATGATFGTPAELEEPDSGTGNDIGGFVAWDNVDSGSSTTAPTITTTATGTVTNVRGPLVVLRIRETLAVRTGDMDATETGSDTAAATGDVIVKGSGAATETGSDTLAASGTVQDPIITGSMAAVETGADTAAATGKVIVAGSIAVNESGTDTLASTGKVLVSGAAAATETGTDTLAASGLVKVAGTATLTETGQDVLQAIGGSAGVTGSMAATETGSDAMAGAGQVLVAGTMAGLEAGSDTLAAAGAVRVRGAMAATETGFDLLLAEGGIVISGAMAASETADYMAVQYVVPGYIDESYVAGGPTGKVLVQGDAAATEVGADFMIAFGPDVNVTVPYSSGFISGVGRLMTR